MLDIALDGDVRSSRSKSTISGAVMRVHNLKGLRTLMVVREVSQRRLARAAGYRSHAYMGRILRGEVDTLEPEAALRIARFLQVGVDFLFAPSVSIGTAHHAQQQDKHTGLREPDSHELGSPVTNRRKA
jgi:transcriptional regulator with XRE-family HTH domain